MPIVNPGILHIGFELCMSSMHGLRDSHRSFQLRTAAVPGWLWSWLPGILAMHAPSLWSLRCQSSGPAQTATVESDYNFTQDVYAAQVGQLCIVDQNALQNRYPPNSPNPPFRDTQHSHGRLDSAAGHAPRSTHHGARTTEHEPRSMRHTHLSATCSALLAHRPLSPRRCHLPATKHTCRGIHALQPTPPIIPSASPLHLCPPLCISAPPSQGRRVMQNSLQSPRLRPAQHRRCNPVRPYFHCSPRSLVSPCHASDPPCRLRMRALNASLRTEARAELPPRQHDNALT